MVAEPTELAVVQVVQAAVLLVIAVVGQKQVVQVFLGKAIAAVLAVAQAYRDKAAAALELKDWIMFLV
jgi:hypothetical protein